MIAGPTPAEIVFVPAKTAGVCTWSRPRRFDFFDTLVAAPIADSEILNLAHYGPIAVRMEEGGLEVVLLLHSAFTTASLVSNQGRWVPPYAPMSLRCLPFRGSGLVDDMEFAPGLCDLDAEQHPFTNEKGGPDPAYAYVLQMLQRLSQGGARLSQAAKMLLAADLLAPLHQLESHPDLSLFVPDPERFARLSAIRAAALTIDANMPLELASAALFSQRWLKKGSIQSVAKSADELPVTERAAPTRPTYHDDLDRSFVMDDSSLFSIDAFLKAVDGNNGGA